VSLQEVFAVYAPLALYQLLPLTVLAVLLEVLSRPRSRGGVTVWLVILVVLVVALWAFIVTRAQAAMREGVGATGEVVAPTRVLVDGRELTLRSRSLLPGTRVNLILNAAGDKVRLFLGPENLGAT
jgi:ferric-dicitrate binding protein FerR (iron transport regulator)